MRRHCQGASYPRGVSPEARRWAMRRQISLLQRALAAWPRRQAPLLEVNCGNGAFLPLLWQWGFDAQGAEACAVLRQTAQRRHVPGLQVHAADDADLPFDNDAFDWVILHLISGSQERIARALQECCRLARRGFMVTFWNSASLPALLWRMGHKKPWLASSAPWRQMLRMVRALNLGHVASFSTLLPPVCAWRWPLSAMTTSSSLAAPGAWCALRLDLGSAAPATPLPLRLGAALKQAEPAMEYSQQRQSQTDNSEMQS